MPDFDFTPTWIALGVAVFLGYAWACVSTYRIREFGVAFAVMTGLQFTVILLATGLAWLVVTLS